MVFAGREREISDLRGALGGGSRLVLVAGDAGIGKTRFVTEGLRGALSVWGACLPLTEKLPFLPIAEALDALSRLEDGALLAGALASIPAYAQAETARLLPHLQAADAKARPAGGQRERMFSGVAELLAAAARGSGLAVVIEDVHWADSATLDFLTFLARTGRADAVTVVATVRSDETPLEPAVSRWLAYARGSGHAQEIRLAPLTREEMAEMAAGLTGGQPSPVDADELYARGEGNPFFTEQLVAEALAAGRRPDGRGRLPARLAGLLTARVSDCGARAWSLLAALSVAGRGLTEEQLADVTGLGAEALRAGLRELDVRSLAETTAAERHRQISVIIGSVSNADWSREAALRAAELRLWVGTPDQVLPGICPALAGLKSPGQAIFCGPLLTAGMRACADLAERARARQDGTAESGALAAGADLAVLAGQLPADPFAEHPFAATIPAEHASWEAERARLAGPGDPAAWDAAAKAWEGFGWPHRAGYAWWRCAEARLSAGQDAAGGRRPQPPPNGPAFSTARTNSTGRE